MSDLLEFISGLLDGVALIALALVLGGIACVLSVLRITHDHRAVLRLGAQRVLSVTFVSTLCLAGLRVIQLLLKPLALSTAMGSSAFTAFSQTQVFHYSVMSVALLLGLAGALGVVKKQLLSRGGWVGVFLGVVAFMVNEGWLSHAASRLEGGGPLMVATVIHVFGATVWSGGIAHLLLLRQGLRESDPKVWSELVSRFSPVGMACVGLIVAPGVYLAWSYVGGWSGLIGTGYGNMVAVKVGLFFCVMVLAALNFFAAREWKRTGRLAIMIQRVPAFIEVEIILAIGLLFTAASLTGFPPSVDVAEATASPAEMWTMYNPKVPRLAGPELIFIAAPELTDLRTGEMGKKEDMSWDRFNHNFSGVVVIGMAIVALFDRVGGFRWARVWPLMFIGFSVLIFVFANPDHWPIGPIGFIESGQNTEVVQHWLAAIVVFGLGWFEWRARDEPLKHKHLQFVFPLLCIVGGIILLTHSHSVGELKEEFLLQSTHVSMGVLGVLLGCGRWLEIRLASPYDRMAGIFSIAAMMLVGLILLFYIKPNLVEFS